MKNSKLSSNSKVCEFNSLNELFPHVKITQEQKVDAEKWCSQNTKDNWLFAKDGIFSKHNVKIHFMSEEDVVMFKLAFDTLTQ